MPDGSKVAAMKASDKGLIAALIVLLAILAARFFFPELIPF
jgi:hypothetical protein